jgi:hypothetical protein
MMETYPLLDIGQAIADADRNLADIIYYTHTLQADTEGRQPPDAEALLANIAALRELLTAVIPPALVQAIAEEQVVYDKEEEGWEPANY